LIAERRQGSGGDDAYPLVGVGEVASNRCKVASLSDLTERSQRRF
jgi:hypothetical protein